MFARLIASTLVFCSFVGNALADPVGWGDCRWTGDPKSRISACTNLISNKRLSKFEKLEAHQRRADAYIDNSDPDAAITDLSTVIAINPRAAEALDARGRAYNIKGDFNSALVDLDLAITLKPRFFYAFNNRGWAYNGLGEYAKAIDSLNQAIRLRPEFDWSFRNRGFAYLSLGAYDLATGDFSRIIERNPNSSQAYNDRAGVFIASKQYAKALPDLKTALTLATNDTDKEELKKTIAAIERILQDSRNATRRSEDTPPTRKQNDHTHDSTDRPPSKTDLGALHQDNKPGIVGQRELSRSRRVALVIGNAAYHNVSRLINPERDARQIARSLTQAGFNDVTLLLNLSLSEFKRAIMEFADKSNNAEWSAVYFAGHGIELGGINYLIPTDATLRSYMHANLELIPAYFLMEAAARASNLKIVILDACRINPFIQGLSNARETLRYGLSEVEPPKDVYVVYSAKHGTLASDGSIAAGGSPFALAFAQHLTTRDIPVQLLFRRVRDSVLTSTAGLQEPFTYGWPPPELVYLKP